MLSILYIPLTILCIMPFVFFNPFELSFLLSYGFLILFFPALFYSIYITNNPLYGVICFVTTSWFVVIEPALCDIILIINIAVFICYNLHRKTLFKHIQPYEFLLFLFIIINIRQVIIDDSLFYPIKHYITTLLLFLLSYYVGRSIDTISSINRIIHYYTISSIITLILMIFGVIILLFNIDILHINNYLLLGNRPKGLFKDPNVTGPFFYLPSFYFIINCLFTNSNFSSYKLFCATLLPLGIILSYSRACIGSFIIVTTMIFLLSVKHGKLAIKIAIISFSSIIFISIFFSPTYKNVSSRVFNTEFGVRPRIERVIHSAHNIKNNFIIGVGLKKNFPEAKKEAHDSYFLMLNRYGVLGFSTFWASIALVLFKLLHSFYHTNSVNNKIIASTLFVTIIAHMITGTVISIFHWRHFWLTLGLSFGYLHCYNKFRMANSSI